LGHGSVSLRYGLCQPTENFGHKILEHGRIEGVDLVLAAALDAHEVRQLEDCEVMCQGRGAKAGNLCQFSGRPLTAAQRTKDGAAMGIRQGAICLLHDPSIQ
jgi:hypothetical protein